MFCAQCGKPVLDGSKFCNHCGAAVAADSEGHAQAPRVAAIAAGASAGSGPAYGSSRSARTPFGGVVARVKNILLSPATEWLVIATEPSSSGALYLGYVAPLVAIGVVATFIGHSVVGLPFVGRVGVGAELAHAIIAYALSFLGVFLIALIVDLLAPSFGGQRDSLGALKVTVYSFTPGWVAGIFNLIPLLGILGIVGALYGLYLLYFGLPVLMRCPADKSVGYTVVTVLCAIVTGVVIAALTTCAVGGLGFIGIGAMSRMGTHSSSSADAAGVLSNLFGGKSGADKARVNGALQTLQKIGEQAQEGASRSGAGQVDVNAALGAVGQIMSGGKDVQPVDFRRLKEMLPESLPGMQRTEASGQGGEAMGFKGSSATARYADGSGASITIELADMASLSGLAAFASKFDANIEKETDSGYVRTRGGAGQLVHERYDRRARNGELSIILADRYAVTVQGSGVGPEALAGALKRIDLTRLASASR